MEAKKHSFVKYRDQNLKGLCLEAFEHLRLSEIPWDEDSTSSDRHHVVKESRTRRVIRFRYTLDGENVLLFAKRARSRNFIKGLTHILIKSKAREEWELLWKLKERSVPASEPVLVAEKRGWLGLLRECYLVTREIPGMSVKEEITRESDTKKRSRLLECAADFMKKSHCKGFYHDDASAEHIFLLPDTSGEEGVQFAFIDVDNGDILQRAPKRLRRKNLFQFLRSFPSDTLDRDEMLLFIKRYYECGGERYTMEQEIKKINRISIRKDGETLL